MPVFLDCSTIETDFQYREPIEAYDSLMLYIKDILPFTSFSVHKPLLNDDNVELLRITQNVN